MPATHAFKFSRRHVTAALMIILTLVACRCSMTDFNACNSAIGLGVNFETGGLTVPVLPCMNYVELACPMPAPSPEAYQACADLAAQESVYWNGDPATIPLPPYGLPDGANPFPAGGQSIIAPPIVPDGGGSGGANYNCSSLRLTSPLDGLPNGVATFYWDMMPVSAQYGVLIKDDQGNTLRNVVLGTDINTAQVDVSQGAVGGGFVLEIVLYANTADGRNILCIDEHMIPREASGGSSNNAPAVPTPTATIPVPR